jgi:hypothetical protein
MYSFPDTTDLIETRKGLLASEQRGVTETTDIAPRTMNAHV